MHNLDDILQLLEVSQETLDKILKAMGWEGLTQFDDSQSELLMVVNAGHSSHGWSYTESYLRNVAHKQGLTPEQYDELASAITGSGSTLGQYRERFEALCQRIQAGEKPKTVIESASAPSDQEIKVAAEKSGVGMEGNELVNLLKGIARANAKKLCETVEELAAMGAADQLTAQEIYIAEYRQVVCETLQSADFKKRTDAIMQGGTETEQKKQLQSLIFGQTIPAGLLPSSN
ncbi:hypothetical protein HRE53_32710 (plasmid) [Acaryochloris sp. 'Moss Beach']|uniref:hypothetical protein n=1 Tax=Acaryochloris sp. 'Moss Beach' TaxID=2740837 RepID=UPI001F31AFD9|nr:hypothetical protein [Acaryochloris sp. 'Moss Beach']UJB73397.1 hypothetical protein HRE53_32710 [Acaryochloris sp. 'Moss Beach']